MQTKKTLGSLIVVIVVSMLAYLIWGAVMKAATPLAHGDGGAVCTLDAMQCPDGSWVGRTGPNCEFICKGATSTEEASSGTLKAHLGQKATLGGESITPLEVLEDSRCPQDVQCIQAGTVRIKVLIESGLGTSEQTLSLNQTMTTESSAISFTSVAPDKKSTESISSSSYVFTFTVSKR
jgi:hypothetical protein